MSTETPDIPILVRSVPYKITEKRRMENRHLTQTPEYKAKAAARTALWKSTHVEDQIQYSRLRYQRLLAENAALAAGQPVPHFEALPRKNSSKKVRILSPEAVALSSTEFSET
jgi:hypothetical protein